MFQVLLPAPGFGITFCNQALAVRTVDAQLVLLHGAQYQEMSSALFDTQLIASMTKHHNAVVVMAHQALIDS